MSEEERSKGLAPSLAGLRVALVHDWLTGMRGGEKCLDVLCRSFPRATLYTLIHQRGSLSPAIESMAIRTSPLQRIPHVFHFYRHLLPVMPLAARGWRLKDVDLVVSLSHCVAKSVVPPAGVPHVCYCFTPMRYAWHARETYLESWSDRPIRRTLARLMLGQLREWDRATASRVTHFVAISETVRGGSPSVTAATAGSSSLRWMSISTLRPRITRRATMLTWSSRRLFPTSASTRPWRPARSRAAGSSSSERGPSGAAGSIGRPDGAISGLAAG